MASARFIPFLSDLTKIPNDTQQCWVRMVSDTGYVLDIQRQDDAYVVSHYCNEEEDPFSQYIAETHELRRVLAEIPLDTCAMQIALYKDGVCIRQESWDE